MKTIVVIGHPNLEKSFVNRSLVTSLTNEEKEYKDVTVHILSERVQQNGHFDILSEQKILEGFDRIVLQFPLYWYMVPSIMKEWLDTVWSLGWAYGDGGDKLKGKRLDVVVTCGAPQHIFTPEIPGMRPLSDFLAFIAGTAAFVQASVGKTFAIYDADAPATHKEIEKYCQSYHEFIHEH